MNADTKQTIERAKTHGMQLGLEAELNVRVNTLVHAHKERKWTIVRSCSVFITDLADELQKLNPNERGSQTL